MIALQIADVKTFMKQFLLSEAFDSFLLLEGTVTTFATFHIDGGLHPEYFYTQEQENMEDRQLALWGEVRPFCLDLIKGKRTPLSFRFTLQLSRGNTEKFLSQTHGSISAGQVRALLLNLRYDGHSLLCTTGTSLSVFTLDKELDHAWDDMVQRFFGGQGIPVQTV